MQLLTSLHVHPGSFSTTDQGTDRGTGVLRFSEMNSGSGMDKDTAKALYQKGDFNQKDLNGAFAYSIKSSYVPKM